MIKGNIHFHCCVINGLFSAKGETLQFNETTLTPEVITRVQTQVRERIPRLFKRRQLLSPEVVEAMREWGHAGGFSLNADVTVPASDRSGLERLFRYCARLIFTSGRLQWIEKEQQHDNTEDLTRGESKAPSSTV